VSGVRRSLYHFENILMHSCIRLELALIALSLCSVCPGSQALDAVTAADHWRALTQLDVEAAYSLLKDNHPGATPEAGDPQFIVNLDAAHSQALARTAQVTSYEGFAAVLGEFAGRMQDGHIAALPRVAVQSLRWAGIIAAKRGTQWMAATVDPKLAPGVAPNSRILSCDGQSAESRAAEVFKFRADATDEASQVTREVWFLADEGNPFLKPPASCEFEQQGKPVSIALQWSTISRSKLLNELWKHPYGEAGFGVRTSGAGYWIGIQQLSPAVQVVVDSVVHDAASLRAAPYVVVDLRGNGGGDDAYARSLAEALYGPEYVAAILGPRDGADGGCSSVYRASADNIEASERAAADMEKRGDATAAADYREANRAMKAAAARGQPLTGPVACPPKPRGAHAKATSLMHGKVVLLTDSACFSSCLQATSFFRALGALHVGHTTTANTHYSEARGILLPSGLATFVTLWAIMPSAPRRVGPFIPAHIYDGDISDTAKIEQWIANMLASRVG
jgi:hypothetical protein